MITLIKRQNDTVKTKIRAKRKQKSKKSLVGGTSWNCSARSWEEEIRVEFAFDAYFLTLV